VNCVQFWADPVARLTDLRSLLRPGGRIAITLQPRHRGAPDLDARRSGDEIAAWLTRVGFHEVAVEMRSLAPVAAACVVGRR
jgi:hypothetical protein